MVIAAMEFLRFSLGLRFAVTEDARCTPEDCWRILEVMERCQAYLAVNVGIKHLFGAVAVKSIGGAAPVETRNK